MFIRFTHGRHSPEKYMKAVLLGNSLVMEFGNKIVGLAKLHEETDRCMDWDVVVATKCPMGGKAVAKSIKDMIGRSNKYDVNPSKKRRKYYVEEFESDFIPVNVSLAITSM